MLVVLSWVIKLRTFSASFLIDFFLVAFSVTPFASISDAVSRVFKMVFSFFYKFIVCIIFCIIIISYCFFASSYLFPLYHSLPLASSIIGDVDNLFRFTPVFGVPNISLTIAVGVSGAVSENA